MPFLLFRSRLRPALAGLMLALCGLQVAQADEPVVNSSLDAPLFYQLLIGELELRKGEAGTAYEVMLDAARRTQDETLFRRSVEIALAARGGDQALAAARAWRDAFPTSLDAHRYLVQILIALNRLPELASPLRSLLALPPESERGVRIAALPRLFERSADRKAVAVLIEQVLAPWLDAPAERTAARVALGRVLLAAGNSARALDLARRAQAQDPKTDGPALLALEMLPTNADAESVVNNYLATDTARTPIRMVYARVLISSQRHADALTQLEIITRSDPDFAAAWLSLGALQLELRHPVPAEAALQRFLSLPQSSTSGAQAQASEDTDEDEESSAGTSAGTTQALLMLAQAAEMRQDYRASEAWLSKIDNPQRALDVQARRASLLAHQGKLKEATALVRATPERSPEDARAKLLVEAQLLRDNKQWQGAYAVLQQAIQRYPDDADLLYEQAMTAEKIGRVDEMESLLRQVIEKKPEHHHAYNALGYSLADRNTRLTEARELIRKALSLAPGEPFITDSLGWVEFRLGNRDEAVRLLSQAYRSRPDVEIGAHLGEVLWATGQRDEARRIWREAHSRDAANDVLRETLTRLRVDL